MFYYGGDYILPQPLGFILHQLNHEVQPETLNQHPVVANTLLLEWSKLITDVGESFF